jgi:hypothetical protein
LVVMRLSVAQARSAVRALPSRTARAIEWNGVELHGACDGTEGQGVTGCSFASSCAGMTFPHGPFRVTRTSDAIHVR